MSKSLNAAIKDLPEDQREKVQDKLVKARENYELRLLAKVQKMVDGQKAKVEFESMVSDKRDRIAHLQAEIKEHRNEVKKLREEIKDARSEYRAQ